MKKIMFISDIHGSATCVEKAIKAYKKEKPDVLIVLGDILYHGPRNPLPEGYDPKGVIKQLNELQDDIIAVRGNCDAEVDQMVLDFDIMQGEARLWIDATQIFATHGHLYANQPPQNLKSGSVFIQGHTHVPIVKKTEQGVWHVNPGSITLPKEGHPKTYAIFEDKKITVKTIEGDCYIEQDLRV
ncbi:phosphodiesterase [Vallitaleaceae bacterium 9-2]